MKVTAIVATGVKNGNTNKICEAILKGAKDNGHKTELINLSDFTISPCTGCFKCADDKPCSIKDDFHKIYRTCAESDVIILGSPVYFGNISGLMKNFFDRHNGNAMFNPAEMADLPSVPKNKRLKTFMKNISKRYRPLDEITGKKVIRVVTSNKPYFLLKLSGELRTTLDAMNRYISELKCARFGTIVYPGTIFNPEKRDKILTKAYAMGKKIR
ncbi:MAG TPA: flavodoxin family protein [Spirochaetota bacterium]|nr:flavodoxin family protein [Spirochaetota bacterium]